MKQLNVGVIGLGDISSVYLNNLKIYEVIQLTACASRSLEKAERHARAHGIARAYASGLELIADPEIDIVLNLTTPDVHGSYNVAALEAGKHLYTEKPLAATLAESREIMRIANEKGLRVGSAPDTFLGGRLQTVRALLDAGTIGDVFGASAFVVNHGHEWHHPNPAFFYEQGAGPLLDIGPYYVTALLSLLGPVMRCSAMSARPFPERIIPVGDRKGEVIPVEMDTHLTGNLEFASGAVATVVTSFDVWGSELPRIELYGTKGAVCIRDIDPLSGPNLFGGPVLLMTEENYRWKTQPPPQPLIPWKEVPVERPFSETGHDANSRGIGLVDMAYAIRDGRPHRASGAMAFNAMEAMFGMITSAEERRFVEMESTFDRPAPLPAERSPERW
ncbi:MAG: Gfo/Idh/MocA family oxidoreductase [Spirochaeta sp.]|jgi:predicted dehydrogenase|nr:Gfo/Idh/MocA family oxidoreductase [Spirochaeta sp.]